MMLGLIRKPTKITCAFCGQECVLPPQTEAYYHSLISSGEKIVCSDCTYKAFKAIQIAKKLSSDKDLAAKRMAELTSMRTAETVSRILQEVEEECQAYSEK